MFGIFFGKFFTIPEDWRVLEYVLLLATILDFVSNLSLISCAENVGFLRAICEMAFFAFPEKMRGRPLPLFLLSSPFSFSTFIFRYIVDNGNPVFACKVLTSFVSLL